MADVYFLIEYPIYREFETEDIDILSNICEEVKLKKGEIIFKEGAPGDALFIIKKGVVKIYKETRTRKKLITILSEGEFFGEMALIDGSPRSATVVADDDIELIKLSLENFNKLKNEYPKTALKVFGALLKFMSYRIRRTTKKAAQLLRGRKIKKTKNGGKKWKNY